jgi:hypothetical protein
MSMAKKLQVPQGNKIRLVNPPKGFAMGVPVSDKRDEDAILLFVSSSRDLTPGNPIVEAAKQDRLAWIAYPKAGKLGTDLNRDWLREWAGPLGIQPVRLVSLDDTWSAMRFRPS